jgi:hypothetical protein
MYPRIAHRWPIQVLVLLLLSLAAGLSSAQSILLSNNQGTGNTVWFVSGERTLVMNGFDLSALNLTYPVYLNAVSISIETPVPGAPIDIVAYADPNGGSPADAVLIGSQQTTIDVAGTARITLNPAIAVDSPVLWVGFYLPVGVNFHADTSGNSVLTYWAWSTGASFDLASPGNAEVLGPGDGSAPVNIAMGGVARITAELSASPPTTDVDGSGLVGQQIVGGEDANFPSLRNYNFCGPVLYDEDDIAISGRGLFTMECRAEDIPKNATADIRPSQNFERRGFLYTLSAFGDFAYSPTQNDKLAIPVTHCIVPMEQDRDQALIGIAHSVPRYWEILPTVRYGNIVCAEVTHIGLLAYFVPRVPNQVPANVNLTFPQSPRVMPHPLVCRQASAFQTFVLNSGFEWPTVPTTMRVTDTLVRTGAVLQSRDYPLPALLGPGQTVELFDATFVVDTYWGELHRLTFTLDVFGEQSETDKSDNVYTTDYILQRGGC